MSDAVTEENWMSKVLSLPVMKTMAENLNASAIETDPKSTPLFNAVTRYLASEGTVIDIGAGVGRFAIPLAQEGMNVTAVEPSEEMRRHLLGSMEQNGISSQIKVIPSPWPLDEDLHADVAFSSFVIQFSRDPVKFIRAMEKSANKRCILAIHVDQPLGFLKEVWKVFHPSETPPAMLTFSKLYPMLLNMGITADATIIEEQFNPQRMMKPDRMISMLVDLLDIKDSPQDISILKEILVKHQQEASQKRLLRSAIISWQPER